MSEPEGSYLFMDRVSMLIALAINSPEVSKDAALVNAIGFIAQAFASVEDGEDGITIEALDIFEVIAQSLVQLEYELPSEVDREQGEPLPEDEIERQVSLWRQRLNGNKEEDKDD